MKGDFHIADWEVQPQLNCIRHGDQLHHLEPKVMLVLVYLATHSNEVLSKDRLMSAVWPDTFVGDDVLTRSISEIRRAFADDARAPRFIQTIPKAGYRLIAPVDFGAAGAGEGGESAQANAAAASGKDADMATAVVVMPEDHKVPPATAPTELPNPASKPRLRILIAVMMLTAIAAGLAGRYWTLHNTPRTANVMRTVPFTSYPGFQTQPAFSPDGSQIAFVWNGTNRDNNDIYVKVVGAETPLRLTASTAQDFSPTWSPDGRSVAFLRYSDEERGIYVVPSLGGAARKIFTPTGKIEWERGSLSWSPDGKTLIFPDGKSANSPSQIFTLSMETLQAQSITRPPERWDGDTHPVFSPDGKHIAFLRAVENSIRDVYVMDADGVDVRRVTFDNRFIEGLTWDAKGRSLIFSSDRGGRLSLWRIRLENGATPERIEVGGDDATAPAIDGKGNRLAYSQGKANWSIMRVALKAKAETPRMTPLLSSTLQDSSPQYSPDGSRIAFQSWRSGTQEIWVCGGDGKSPVKLTSFEGPLTGSPSWSPDGSHIAFDARPDGHSHVYTMTTEGALPKAATSGESNDIVPSWSHDGKWIYFGSNRSGAWQIWKVPAEGGEAQQVTRDGGFVGRESPNGRWLYYTKTDVAGLWRIPVAGGAEEKILDSPQLWYWGYWSLTPEGIYYLDKNVISFKNIATGTVTRVMQVSHVPPPFAGLTTSPDGTSLLFTDLTEASSNITLVENFR